MRNDAWNALSYLESFDLVQRRFKQWHGLELNAERTSEIVSAFLQGREYYNSAAESAEAVKPLLLYYAVLSACRGIIVFQSGKSEATLKPSHGIELQGLENSKHRQSFDLLMMEAKVTNGTFSELGDATKNLYLEPFRTENGGILFGARNHNVGFTSTNPDCMLFDDLLSREPKISKVYAQCTGRPSKVVMGSITHDENELHIQVMQNSFNPFNEKELRSCLQIPDDVVVGHIASSSSFFTNSYRLPHLSGGTYALHPVAEGYHDSLSSLVAP